LVLNAVGGSNVVIHPAWSFANDPQTIFGTANLFDAVAASGTRRFFDTTFGGSLSLQVLDSCPDQHNREDSP
jgi:hypothetical protein